MPRRSILSATERESLLALPDAKDELIRHYTFNETDLSVIRQRRGAANRLGFAVQLCYLRFPGIFLGVDEPPFPPLLRMVAAQLKVPVESWNDALSPWEAPAVWGKQGFGGKAGDTLCFLTEQVIPTLKQQFHLPENVKIILGGYSLGGADMLRRAMGKKKPEEMAKQREIFVTGATNRGIDSQVSGGIFDLMEKFAGYGFNKSHSAAYGVVAYHTAWLKAHYPAEFMSAVLTSEMQNTDNVVFIIDDCRGLGLTILPPNVNLSDFRFRAADPKTIVYGLGAIKGVGEAAMQSVMDARASGGTFRDLFDFCHRIDLKKANKRTLEALIRAGALDCLGIERAELMDQLPEAVQAADQARQNRESGMFDLFGEVEEVQRKPSQHKLLVWSDEVRLKGEKDTLGLYLTGHPIDVYQDELKRLIPSRLNSLTGTRRGQTTVFAGLIMDVLNFSNRIVILLDDGTGRIEVSCGQEKFQRYKELLQVEQIVVIEGEVMERDGFDRPMGRLSKAFGMNEIRAKRVNAIHIHLKPALLHPQLANQLHTMLHPFCSGDTRRIPIHIQMPHYYANVQLQLGETWWVRPEDALLRQLREQFGKNSLEIVYQQRTARANHEQEMSG